MNRFVERAQPRLAPGLARAGRFLWEVFWLPFWLGSTLPPPPPPGRPEAVGSPGRRTPAILRRLDALRDAIWCQRAAILTFRTLWLALAVLDVWLALRVVARRDVPLWPFLAIVLLVLPLGAIGIARARPSRGQMARTLDRSFGLRERVATAMEEAQHGRLAGVRALQVLEATRVTGAVGGARVFRRRVPLREIALTALAAALLTALLIGLLMSDPLPPAPGAGAAPGAEQGAGLPGLLPGTEPGANPSGAGARDGAGGQNGAAGQNGQGQQGQEQRGPRGSGPSAQGQRDLDALAGALQDHAATREAADALAAGGYAGAAGALREAGANAPNMSPEARRELARDLRAAAGQVNDPQLAQDLHNAANALERPDAAGAQSALDRVASDIDRVGQGQPPPNGQSGAPAPQGGDPGAQPPAGQTGGSGGPGASPQLPGDQRAQPPPGPSTPPLGANGQPVELPRGPGGQPIPSQGQNSRGAGPPDPGSAGTGDGQMRQGEVGEAGTEVNRVPVEQRGAVERYFTPRNDPDDRR